jgi:tRNA nucleotidyltransferase/poly(A) polymerase
VTENETDREEFLCGEDAKEARRIIARLREAGFVAYLAGGCVRDALLGKHPKDYDVATDATPDAVRQVFGRSRTLAFGASFGVIGVLPERGQRRDSNQQDHRNQQAIQPTEVATFRSDGTYSDGRRPDSVHFGHAREDALRRDFTINGLFYDPEQHEIVDYVGGEADLARGVLRTIGDAATRIEEDKLRMLRAVRFATTLGFSVDSKTIDAITTHADTIAAVSGERIGAEMRRVLTSVNSPAGLAHLASFGLHRVVLCELDHFDSVRYRAITRVLHQQQSTEPSFPVALACLLIVLPDSLAALRRISSGWKLSNEESRKAGAAIKHAAVIQQASSLAWSRVQPILVDRDATMIVEVASAIVAADGSESSGITLARQALLWPPERLDPVPLLTGDDLNQLGVPAGPQYRTILQSLRDAQLDGRICSRDEAIAALPDF